MTKEKNYSKRLQEIEQSNLATLPKRFVDMERQRDKFKKEAEQYLEARNKAEHERNDARREISRLKLQLQYYGQKPLQLEVAHYERYCEGCKHYNDGVYCSASFLYLSRCLSISTKRFGRVARLLCSISCNRLL